MDRAVIRKLLVANRGEIAIRIARTCREMGIHTIWAHSDEDALSTVRLAFDESTSLGAGESRHTYLNIDAVIHAAKRCGADAIHPGYGFLSERAELARACEDNGIIFVGPSSRSIAMMGSKAESRQLMRAAGVPVVPGYDGENQTIETLVSEAKKVGYPMLVKASAGGGGKGMKIVRAEKDLRPAIESAKREALKSFGDDRLLIERYIEEPRHVEFQIFGDAHGNVVHLFERDCSIQRRHQKVVEETPAPDYPDELRQRMARAAVAAAKAVDYRNAGTVEFIVTPEREFYFLEMNTRLQVEHPVTEAVVGVDLVRAQLDVAAGELLPWRQEDLHQRGHAMEVRIYAEDPDNGFLPQAGKIEMYREPTGPGIRVDSGVGEGSEIKVLYDPMLAKVIAFAETREQCIARLSRALADFVILGTITNVGYLRRIITHPAFIAGEVSTHFIAQHETDLLRPEAPMIANAIAAVIASEAAHVNRPAATETNRAPRIWDLIGNWGR